jgi:hypothetical protein
MAAAGTTARVTGGKCMGGRRKVHGQPEESAWVVGGKFEFKTATLLSIKH